MKIVVTGANGYLGQGIVTELLNHGHKVIATDFSTDRVDERAEKIEEDIFKILDPFNVFAKPDVLLHLAWKDGFIHNSPAHIIDLPQHFTFINKMILSGIKKVTILGSMHEIGFFEGAINENTPCHPLSLYGIGKNALRETVELLSNQNGTLFQWLRGFYIVGNSQYGNSIFSKITQAVENGEIEFPFTSGKNQYDFLEYEQFCKQVAATVEQDKILGIINIASGRPTPLSVKVEQFIKDNNYNIKLVYGAFPDRPYDSTAVWGDDKKIRKILNTENNVERRF